MKFTFAEYALIRDAVENRLHSVEDSLRYYADKREDCWAPRSHYEETLEKERDVCLSILRKFDDVAF